MFSELFAYLRIFFGNKAGKDIQANTFYLSDTNNSKYTYRKRCPEISVLNKFNHPFSRFDSNRSLTIDLVGCEPTEQRVPSELARKWPSDGGRRSQDGSWRLSPAYDITYIIDNGGFLPNEDHCLYIRAKLRSITREDAIQFARDNGIRRPDAIIRDVVAALKQFRAIATKYGVLEQWTGRVETTIIDHLKAWGKWQESEMPEKYFFS